MNRQKLQKKIRTIFKPYYNKFRKKRGEKKILLIVGCQRSGTTMLNEIFDRDWRTRTYGENGGLAKGRSMGTPFRWRPYHDIKSVFDAEKAMLLVAKPLVESQHIWSILEFFKEAKAIWMYRHFEGVISSNIIKFGPAAIHYNLRAIYDPTLNDHWFSENVTGETRNIIEKFHVENTSIEDLQALGWYARNILYFDQKLNEHPRIRICRYEDMVLNPKKEVERLYHFIDMDYPGSHIVRFVHSKSERKGRGLQLSDNIRKLCQNLQNRMDEAHLKELVMFKSCGRAELQHERSGC